MLRATSNSLTKANAWKNTAIYSSVRNYATPNATPAPANDNKEKKPSLSQRLGGTGRGKIMEGSSDPFASFLANAKKPRNNNNNRNGSFTPRNNRKPQESEGQFADAPEQSKQQRPRNDNNNNNRNNAKNRNNRQNRQNEKQNVEGASATAADQSNNNNINNTNNNRRNNKNNNNNNNNRNNAQNGGGKKMNLRRSQQPQEIRTRRATTFIDKDIDWASFETAEATETQVEAAEKDSDELVLKDVQGNYGRYISTGSDLKWPPMIQGETLSTLVGSNPTFDLQQKTAFMAAVTKVFNGNAAGAAARK